MVVRAGETGHAPTSSVARMQMATLPDSLANKFQEALQACEAAGACETPAPQQPRREVRFNLEPQLPQTRADDVQLLSSASPIEKQLAPGGGVSGGGAWAWLSGKKGWFGATIGLLCVSLLAAAALYLRKRFIAPLIYGGGGKKRQNGDKQGGRAQQAFSSPVFAYESTNQRRPIDEGGYNNDDFSSPPVIPAFAKRHLRFQNATVATAPPPRSKKASSRKGTPAAVAPTPLVVAAHEDEEEEPLEQSSVRRRLPPQHHTDDAAADPGFDPI